MGETCLELLGFTRVMDRRGGPKYRPLNPVQGEFFQSAPAIRHSPFVQDAEWPDDIRNALASGNHCRHDAGVREERVDMDDMKLSYMFQQPVPQLEGDLVEPRIPSKINVMDPLIIGTLTRCDRLSFISTVVVRRCNGYFNALLAKSTRHHGQS